MTSSRVSVIVPVYNGGASFDACLSALAALDPAPLDVIIVDDCSTDGSYERAVERGFHVRRTVQRAGPAAARNLGAEDAHGDILLFVDADVVVPPNVAGRVAELFDAEPETAAVIGCYDESAPDRGFFTQYKNLYQRYVHQRARRDAFTFWGACGAIRRTVFAELGGFDADYSRASIEDIELGYRLRDAGYHLRLDRTIEITHLKRWTLTSLLRSDIFYRAIPWTSLILRSKRMERDLNLGWSHRLAVVASFLAVLSLAAAIRRPDLLVVTAVCVSLLVVLDARLGAYFASRRGVWFALRAIAWQWVHYLYSGLAFGAGLMLYAVRRRAARVRVARSNASAESV
jgi:GT2 family glycosyltransferase